MRRFILTNPEKFIGTAEITYNQNGTLCKIDLTQTNMPPLMVNHFKQMVPAQFTELAFTTSFGKDTTIIEAAFEVTFDMFWTDYNKKINRKRTLALWDKKPKTEQVLAWSGIPAYDRYIQQNEWYNKQDPDTYLRNETYKNDWKTPKRGR